MPFPRAFAPSEMKQSHPGFEFRSPIPFPTRITVMLSIHKF